MTLLLAILVMVMLSVTTVTLLAVGVTEPLIANNLLHSVQAFYLAESGLEIALLTLNHDEAPTEPLIGALGGGIYTVVFIVMDPDHVEARSVGRIAGAVRVVTNRFERVEGFWRPMPQFHEEAA